MSCELQPQYDGAAGILLLMIVKLTIGKMKSSRLSSSCFQYSSTDDFSVTVKVRNRYLSFGSNLYFKLILIDEFFNRHI